MTLPRFVVRNLLRNKRRSLLTALSLAFSFLLLIFMISIWRSFYVDDWTAKGALRLVCRHRVSLFLGMPSYYEQKIREIPGVINVTPMNQFWGMYHTDQGEDHFLQIGVDPRTFLDSYAEYQIPADQVQAWQQDAAGAIVSDDLARKHHWRIGERIVVQGVRYPFDIELNLRGIYHSPMAVGPLYFNWNYVEQTLHRGKDEVFLILADSPHDVGRIAVAVDKLFRNAPEPTRTEAEKAFDLDMVATIGNLKLFILSICLAVLFAMLLVAANTIAMSIRERTREVAVLRSMGFAPRLLLSLLVSESVGLCVAGWLLASLVAYGTIYGIAHSPGGGAFQTFLKLQWPTIASCFLIAMLIGAVSAALPAHRASHTPIAEGLRHTG